MVLGCFVSVLVLHHGPCFTLCLKQSLFGSRSHTSPLLSLNFGDHFGVECVGQGGRQRAEGRAHDLLGLMNLKDLSALGEAL